MLRHARFKYSIDISSRWLGTRTCKRTRMRMRTASTPRHACNTLICVLPLGLRSGKYKESFINSRRAGFSIRRFGRCESILSFAGLVRSQTHKMDYNPRSSVWTLTSTGEVLVLKEGRVLQRLSGSVREHVLIVLEVSQGVGFAKPW